MMGGLQTGLIFALQHARSKHVNWPIILMAILSAVLLAAGVLRHYWDIYIHRTVRGISFIFVGIDAMGDLTSLISVFFQPKLDIFGMAIYATELLLWLGVFACGGYYNLVPWIRKQIERRHFSRSPAPPEIEAGQSGETHQSEGITLHEIPSSSSVFRTPSGEIAAIRARSNFHCSGPDERDNIYPPRIIC
jgi:hypothetical protein